MPNNNQGQIKIKPILIILMLSFLVFDIIAFAIIFSHKKSEKPIISEKKEESQAKVEKDQPKPPQIDTSAYQEYLDKYPQNTHPSQNERFTIYGTIAEINTDFLVLNVAGDNLKINYLPDSGVEEAYETESISKPFDPLILKKGKKETLMVKKSEKDEELDLIAVFRIII